MIRHAEDHDFMRINTLWSVCFPDDEKNQAFFFERMYKKENAWVFEQDGVIQAMIHAIPYTVVNDGCERLIYYIYGVGCDPDARGRGYAGALISHIIFLSKEKHAAFCMLVPQEESLFDYYARFGFLPIVELSTEVVPILWKPDREVSLINVNAEIMSRIYESVLKNTIHIKRTLYEWKILIDEIILNEGHILMTNRAYAFVTQNGQVIEAFAVNEESLAELLCIAVQSKKKVIFTRPGIGKKYASFCITDPEFHLCKEDAYFNLLHD